MPFLCIGLVACKSGGQKDSAIEPSKQDSTTVHKDSAVAKNLLVKKIDIDASDIEAVSRVLSELCIENIDNVNWPKQFPYKPDVSFRIAHNGENILLQYEVQEDEIRGEVTEDNGPVWNDSCVELFLSFDNQYYYNLETTCIGTTLISYRNADGSVIQHADSKIMKSIKRLPSLGTKKRAKEQGDFHWTLTLVIPHTVYWKSDIKSFDGIQARGNFYKCGDELTKPHFVSWSPISSVERNFHQPEYFGYIEFEK